MKIEIDSLSVKDLEARYGVARSNIYNRIDGLKKLGYDLEPEKQGNKSIYNADQITLMDRLDEHLKLGEAIATFPNAEGVLPVLQDNSQPSYRTQDKPAIETTPPALGMAAFIDSIVTRITEAYPQQQYSDPLANLRHLQEVSDRGWLLSSSQLAPLLGRRSMPSKDFDRFGFRFVKAGKNGSETAWKVIKD